MIIEVHHNFCFEGVHDGNAIRFMIHLVDPKLKSGFLPGGENHVMLINACSFQLQTVKAREEEEDIL
jgi:hypothetical protein